MKRQVSESSLLNPGSFKRILFIGDITGESALEALERQLPLWRTHWRPDFVVVNAENLAVTGHEASSGFGMTPAGLARLFGLGVDLVTGGNHSWDGPYAAEVHRDMRVVRPLNYSAHAPGRGAGIIKREGFHLGVVNLVSRSALSQADAPLDALERQLQIWGDSVDAVVVDFHGESVAEKLSLAFAVDGQVAAVLGTHTHVPTLDTRVLPGGTAYVSDVGMTGPGGGLQGIAPGPFVESLRSRLPATLPMTLATGTTEFGAVLVTLSASGRTALSINRLDAAHGDVRLWQGAGAVAEREMEPEREWAKGAELRVLEGRNDPC
ncbi:YmdB family metallophosphoesterase [Deinococcus frigens]|uniref:YmdB family metallophosphoesterase n=1 Tax=Deinococcus frigens TaxID=249403 RepID=UPI000692555D|nr:YmdB family metallophosphoesterase [Deinococcus frigens]